MFNKKQLILTLSFMCLFLLFKVDGQAVEAASGKYFEVTQDDVTVYDNSTGKLVPIGWIKNGEKYEIVSDVGNWYKINFYGQNGFVYKPATKPADASGVKWVTSSSKHTYGAHALENLTIYENQSSGRVPIGRIFEGQSFKYISESGSWMTLEIGGRKGVVYAPATKKDFKDSDQYFEVIQDDVTVYDNSTGKLVPIGWLKKGEVYKREKDLGSWHKIQFEGRSGYVYKPATKPASAKGFSFVSTPSKHTKEGRALEDITVYDNSSGKRVPMARIFKGQSFNYIKQSGSWMQVQIGNRTGYVYAPAVGRPFTKQDDYFRVYENNVTLYAIIDGERKAVGKLQKGESYKRLRQQGSFHVIQYGDGEAHIYVPPTTPTTKGEVTNLTSDTKHSNEFIFLSETTNVYSKPNGNSERIATLNKNVSYPLVEDLKNGWAKVIIANKVGYIHSFTGEVEVKKYNVDFNRMVDIQMQSGNPKYDGAGKISADEANVRYYLNPANFDEGTAEFLQFLILDAPANISATEINNKYLKGKGILEGQGKAFIEAGLEYNLNEFYLIAHALHETANGTSTLARGIGVDANGNIVRDGNGDIIRDINHPQVIHVVYNMYGYGAVDSDPINGGAKYAFEHGWFTPHEAIVGGAKDISNKYIEEGQNTLYKMKWDPDFVEVNNKRGKQYATHVMWPVLQARKIGEMLGGNVKDLVLFYELPQYVRQPGPDSKVPPAPKVPEKPTDRTFPQNVKGEVTVEAGSTLRMRKDPVNGTVVGAIPSGEVIDIIGMNDNGWLKVRYNGKEGWSSAEFINVFNLYVVNASPLNYRDNPAGNRVGQLQNGTLVTVELDDNNEVISQDAALNGTTYTWYQINVNGNLYWTANDFLEKY
ncbi:SH3 domain-containing protein [Bacillaceae bacterium W0354]